ncbi:MAG: hypothetical protein R3228_18275 [Halioglobus sp.]|nr:hypothetical protein [Halioglobus sp.]
MAQEPRFNLEVEAGAVWQERNKVQIPNDDEGDRFALTDIAGSGPWASARINAHWDLGGPHGLRVVLAPLSYSERGRLRRAVRFEGEIFAADTALRGKYRFNSWRAGYRYRYYDERGWQLWVGATAKVRDAQIELVQGQIRASDDNIGLVPLLHLAGDYRFDDRWSFRFDFDGLAGGPGRAFDVSVKLGYRLSDRWRLSAGYRTLEGGADTDDVYNFAWFNTALVAAEYRY